jgi:hypothetical protein
MNWQPYIAPPCDCCALRMTYSYSKKKDRQYPYYVCLNAQRKGWSGAGCAGLYWEILFRADGWMNWRMISRVPFFLPVIAFAGQSLADTALQLVLLLLGQLDFGGARHRFATRAASGFSRLFTLIDKLT